MATSNLTLRITNKAHDGYRRAGVVFDKGINDVAASAFNKDQLAAIEADPRLSITVPDEVTPAETSAPEGAVDHDGVDDPLAKGMETLLALIEADELELNNSGKPNADALGVNAKQRDQIWSDYQAQTEQDAE